MTSSRAESQHSSYGRRRSNTSQSVIRAVPPSAPPPTPLKIGDTRLLNAWVHEPKDSSNVLFNHLHWPGVAEGDLIRVTVGSPDNPHGFLFKVGQNEGARYQLQISIPKPLAEAFDVRNNVEVTLTKVEPKAYYADHMELVFQDQYLGRSDMWRMGEYLTGQCIYTNQEVTYIGGIVAKVQAIYSNGVEVSAGVVTALTKSIYRSLSAKVTIYIQVCKELWEFAGDGERYYEKIIHSFLPSLFGKWREAGTNHTVTIVLISRVFYEESEIDYAAGPLRRDERGNWYKDFYKVITDLEVNYEWNDTLVSLKNSFWAFQRDILLAHHYHRACLDSKLGLPSHIRLVGQISYAHDGPILEALNLGLNPTETHHIDRSLSLTGATYILITPGTGYFRVSKALLRLTTMRMLDQGVVLNLILLTKQPLHQSPIFSFQGIDPSLKEHDDPLSDDPLWCDDANVDHSKKKTFWWEPFWLSTTFWDKQKDLPIRYDRFVARAKMHEIQMLGLLEHDVLASIEVPFLPERPLPPLLGIAREDTRMTKEEADNFDNEIFASGSTGEGLSSQFTLPSAMLPIPGKSEKRTSNHRNSTTGIRIQTIEESPRKIHKTLPDEGLPTVAAPKVPLSTSPSQASIRSARSEVSTASAKLRALQATPNKGGLASKLTPSWLFNPFRSSGISEPQTSQVIAAGSSANSSANTTPVHAPVSIPAVTPATPRVQASTPISMTPSAPIQMPANPTRAAATTGQHPNLALKGSLGRSTLRHGDDNLAAPPRGSFSRRSPLNTPPRDEYIANKRRSTANFVQSMSSGSPGSYSNPSNPSQPQRPVSYLQSSMARRWHHVLPHPLKKHDIKWKALVTPACLPLTVDYFPTSNELESCYELHPYEFVVNPKELKSMFLRPPNVKETGTKGQYSAENIQAWALVTMRAMAGVRLAQGFQFVLKPAQTGTGNHFENEYSNYGWNPSHPSQRAPLARTASALLTDEPSMPMAVGSNEALINVDHPIFLSMTNEIHMIWFNGEAIKVRRYTRRMPIQPKFKYQCLIWPKLGVGYTELSTTFESYGLDHWNRLDMLISGYQTSFEDVLRYWRTRFVVLPTSEPPTITAGPGGEKLNEEEIRILGIDKLGEIFTKLRWYPPGVEPNPPIRFLPTTHDPAQTVFDDVLMQQLAEICSNGPLKKNMNSDKEIAYMSFTQVATLMRAEPGLIKHNQWHKNFYPNSFVGSDFVSWLVREFRDVSSRVQATEWGIKFLEQGFIEHCRNLHPFLDGHYFYRLKGDYSVPMTPSIKGWFKRGESDARSIQSSQSSSSLSRSRLSSSRKKTQLIFSQSTIIDLDPHKRSNQAETALLHHDIVHNPSTVFHFELQWIGTTARVIEDQLRQWNRVIEKYGLKLVEAYVGQISDIRDRNPFQSCFPIRFAVPPPVIPDIEKRIQPEGSKTARYYFEYALLRKFGFVLDVEAQDLYVDSVDVVYSYRRSPYHYSQFVHRSGLAFVQVLDGGQGFLFLTNRLMGTGRMGAALKSLGKSGSVAAITRRSGLAGEDIRLSLYDFCQDREKLMEFYDEQLALLPPCPQTPLSEEPPSLTI